MNFRNSLTKNGTGVALLSALIFFAYFPLLGKTTFSPDAHIILPPLLEASLLEYLKMLATFEVVDFQPVRDLSFFVDIFFYNHLGLTTFSATNVLLWCLACTLIFKLVKRNSPELPVHTVFLLVSAFAVYPLFSQAVSWTMARKHLMAFTLILLTTHFYLDWLKGRRKWFAMYLCYVAAVLSHPIVSFWPCWAFLHQWLYHRKRAHEDRNAYIFFFLTMGVLLLTNYAYYVVLSPRLHEYYTQARPSFSLTRIFNHFFFYFRQLVWPYRLSFTYYPDLSTIWPGFLMTGALGVLAWMKRKNPAVLSWIFFALFPFPVFIGLSIYDQYLLIPAAGFLVTIAVAFPHISRNVQIALTMLIFFWAGMTFLEASRWPIKGSISQRNFENAPSCRSVIEAINSISQVRKEMSPGALDYFEKANCQTVVPNLPPAEKPKALVAHSLFLFYRRDKLGEETVTQYLKSLGQFHYFPLLLYSVILAEKNNVKEVKRATEFIYERAQGPLDDTGPVVLETLGPFCREHELTKCSVLLRGRFGRPLPFF